ncbi:MAG: NifB/NifX family molybdenum-iron cluster-binding protein [Planctomycetota bacterium]
MRIAISAQGPEPGSALDRHFGRAPYFMLVEEDDNMHAIANKHVDGASGVGIQTAQLLINHRVTHVLTGECGPKAMAVLNAGDIQVVTACQGTVADAIAAFRNKADTCR